MHSADEPYRLLVEEMQEGAVVLTDRGDILYANAPFAALVGEPLASVVGSCVNRFVNMDSRDDFEALVASGHGRCRSRFTGPNSGIFEVSLSLTTTTSSQGDRLNLIVTDLTELLQARTSRDRAERDSRSKDDFLAMLSHELRTPLAAIGSAVRVLELTQGAGASLSRAHDVIARQVSHVTNLINDLLDVERVVAGKIRLNRVPIDLALAVGQAVATFTNGALMGTHIDFSTEPVWVDGDAERLQQILTNLVTNAIKFSSPGASIRVRSVPRPATPCSASRIPVRDFAEAPVRLRPVRAGRSDARSRAGRSRDRAVARPPPGGVARGDDRGVERGRGPRQPLCRPAAADSAGDTVGRGVAAAGAPCKPRRILVIEDNADAREMLRMVLELAGHAVYDAPDGVAGSSC